jgi:hypothetical protein
MPHSVIFGQTESGKTTLAKQLAAKYKASGIKVIVYDPMFDPNWPSDFRTADINEFNIVWRKSRSCAIFMDESRKEIGENDNTIEPSAIGRHWGHNFYFISQRFNGISPLTRTNCSKLYLFSCSQKDAKIYYDDWGKEEILQAPNLKQFEFLEITRFSTPIKYKLKLCN